MVEHAIETDDIKRPFALRETGQPRMTKVEGELRASAGRADHRPVKRMAAPLRPIVLGAAAALLVGLALDIGPWGVVAGTVLGPADAQEVPQAARPAALAEPSEADRAALRYFAREGDVDRLEAELRRLRALYPGWQPPPDLLDPESGDAELQRIYDLVGQQDYVAARQLLAERRQRDPAFTPPARLVALLELAEIRQQLRTASDSDDFAEVLRIAQENERILTCDDPDSIWRVAEAFARTDRTQRAYDAYAYVINTCEDLDARAATLQKAATQLDTAWVTQLFDLGVTGADGTNEFSTARLDIVRGAMAHAGSAGGEGTDIPPEWLDILAQFARTGTNLEDAMLIGYYLYRQGNPAEAALWFRFALDNGFGSDAAEGYIIALRATGDREDAALAREVAYQWREQTPELMEAYLDAVSTILTADELGQTSIEDVEQASVDRFVPIVIGQRDPNGAQALGWYAFNTCQFIIAEEWFISSANWVPTEAALYGLALTRLRLGDQRGFEEVIDEWGPLYRSLEALATGGEDLDPADPVTGGRDDPTDEVGIESVVCDPAERERLRRFIVEQRTQIDAEPISFTQAGSLTAAKVRPLARRPAGAARPAIPRRSAVIRPREDRARAILTQAQLSVPTPTPTPPQPAPPTAARHPVGAPTVRGRVVAPDPDLTSARDAGGSESVVRQRALGRDPRFRDTPAQTTIRRRQLRLREGEADLPVERRAAATQRGVSTVERRVRTGTASVDDEVRRIVERPRRLRRSGGSRSSGRRGSVGGTTAQQALASKQYARCVAVTDAGIRSGTLSAADASARGFCLLQLERPVEAAQAFQLAKIGGRVGATAAADAAYGTTLAYLAADLTKDAGVAATQAPMSRPRRTELQINILTQRALAANRDRRYTEALYLLDQRNRIAPLQKDLMILQGFAYRNAGDVRAAARILEAVDRAGSTPQSRQAIGALYSSGNTARLGTIPN